MQRGLWIVLAVAALVLAGSAWFIVQNRVAKVETARVSRGPAVDLVYATGFVEPQQPVEVSSRVTAPVKSVLVDESAHVGKGQPLVLLDDAQQRGLLAQAEAQAIAATLAEQRAVTLFKQGWVTKAARDEAVAAGASARAQVATAKAQLDQFVIRAGISGTVLKKDVYPGDLAVPGKELLQLGDPALARVTATVDERDITRVHIGQPALMSSEALGHVVQGFVTEITPNGDPTQRAFRVRIGLSQGAALPFGLTLEVNVVTARHDNALLVPASALHDGHVFVVAGGRAHLRPIRQGITGPDKVEVLSGLKPGEPVVTNPPEGLEDGDRVRQ